MAALASTVTVVNKSGKVSKHLVNVFKEARAAYRERKAEIKATRTPDSVDGTPRKSQSVRAPDESRSSHKPSRDSVTHKSKNVRRPTGARATRRLSASRGHSDSQNSSSPRLELDAGQTQPSPLRHEQRRSERPDSDRTAYLRRHSESNAESLTRRSRPASAHSESSVDSGLAYGELPPPLLTRAATGVSPNEELTAKATYLQRLLEEANCLQHSASATIKSLEANPDAMAAVALTLAEISNMVSKMAPGAILGLRTAFPAVIALLASPEFLIAAGVGVGIMIVSFGGYKIIKRIKGQNAARKTGSNTPNRDRAMESPFEAAPSTQQESIARDATIAGIASDDADPQLEEITVQQELARIQSWHRGIADADTVEESVDGEFVTPGARRMLHDEGVLDWTRRVSRSTTDLGGASTSKSTSHEKGKDKDREAEKARAAAAKKGKANEKPPKKEKLTFDEAERQREMRVRDGTQEPNAFRALFAKKDSGKKNKQESMAAELV